MPASVQGGCAESMAWTSIWKVSRGGLPSEVGRCRCQKGQGVPQYQGHPYPQDNLLLKLIKGAGAAPLRLRNLRDSEAQGMA